MASRVRAHDEPCLRYAEAVRLRPTLNPKSIDRLVCLSVAAGNVLCWLVTGWWEGKVFGAQLDHQPWPPAPSQRLFLPAWEFERLNISMALTRVVIGVVGCVVLTLRRRYLLGPIALVISVCSAGFMVVQSIVVTF